MASNKANAKRLPVPTTAGTTGVSTSSVPNIGGHFTRGSLSKHKRQACKNTDGNTITTKQTSVIHNRIDTNSSPKKKIDMKRTKMSEPSVSSSTKSFLVTVSPSKNLLHGQLKNKTPVVIRSIKELSPGQSNDKAPLVIASVKDLPPSRSSDTLPLTISSAKDLLPGTSTNTVPLTISSSKYHSGGKESNNIDQSTHASSKKLSTFADNKESESPQNDLQCLGCSERFPSNKVDELLDPMIKAHTSVSFMTGPPFSQNSDKEKRNLSKPQKKSNPSYSSTFQERISTRKSHLCCTACQFVGANKKKLQDHVERCFVLWAARLPSVSVKLRPLSSHCVENFSTRKQKHSKAYKVVWKNNQLSAKTDKGKNKNSKPIDTCVEVRNMFENPSTSAVSISQQELCFLCLKLCENNQALVSHIEDEHPEFYSKLLNGADKDFAGSGSKSNKALGGSSSKMCLDHGTENQTSNCHNSKVLIPILGENTNSGGGSETHKQPTSCPESIKINMYIDDQLYYIQSEINSIVSITKSLPQAATGEIVSTTNDTPSTIVFLDAPDENRTKAGKDLTSQRSPLADIDTESYAGKDLTIQRSLLADIDTESFHNNTRGGKNLGGQSSPSANTDTESLHSDNKGIDEESDLNLESGTRDDIVKGSMSECSTTEKVTSGVASIEMPEASGATNQHEEPMQVTDTVNDTELEGEEEMEGPESTAQDDAVDSSTLESEGVEMPNSAGLKELPTKMDINIRKHETKRRKKSEAAVKNLTVSGSLHFADFEFCPMCRISLPDKASLDWHIKMDHIEQESAERRDSEECKPVLDMTVDSICPDLVICLQCHVLCKDMEELKFHVLTKHSEKKYLCPHCGFVSKNRKTSYMHSLKHKEKKFKCVKCGFRSHSEAILERHFRRRHTPGAVIPEKRCVLCTLCGKTLASKESYKLHMLMHKNVRPFQCPQCPYRCRSKSNLDCHMKTHSDVKYQCQLCSFACNFTSSLRRHYQSQHKDSDKLAWRCPLCPYVSWCNSGLKRHCRVRHGMLLDNGEVISAGAVSGEGTTTSESPQAVSSIIKTDEEEATSSETIVLWSAPDSQLDPDQSGIVVPSDAGIAMVKEEEITSVEIIYLPDTSMSSLL